MSVKIFGKSNDKKATLKTSVVDEMDKYGYSLDDKRNPIEDNDIDDIVERFNNLDKEVDRKRTEQSFFVPVEEIRENGYDLSINKYKEV